MTQRAAPSPTARDRPQRARAARSAGPWGTLPGLSAVDRPPCTAAVAVPRPDRRAGGPHARGRSGFTERRETPSPGGKAASLYSTIMRFHIAHSAAAQLTSPGARVGRRQRQADVFTRPGGRFPRRPPCRRASSPSPGPNERGFHPTAGCLSIAAHEAQRPSAPRRGRTRRREHSDPPAIHARAIVRRHGRPRRAWIVFAPIRRLRVDGRRTVPGLASGGSPNRRRGARAAVNAERRATRGRGGCLVARGPRAGSHA